LRSLINVPNVISFNLDDNSINKLIKSSFTAGKNIYFILIKVQILLKKLGFFGGMLGIGYNI
jgi:hypothetical protein